VSVEGAVASPPIERRARGVPVPAFRYVALANFVSMIAVVLTGAAVRLSSSGLGCPDWPTCFKSQVTKVAGYHSVIEYANRMVTVAVTIVAIVTLLAAIWRERRRGDLIALAGVLVAGILANAVLGAAVVYSHLNPWLVSGHMVLSLGMVALAATLYHRSKYRYGAGAPAQVRDAHFLVVARLLWAPFAAVVLAGTVTTGAGPHPGSNHGQEVARRLPIAFSSATWIHSVAATVLIALVAGLLLAVWRTSAPAPLQFGVRRLFLIALAQGIIGLAQYGLHVPVALVELHVAGAISVTIAITQFNLRQVAREREPGTRRASP
jgi:cytochrome c oxidase assembly protein subunit 15